MNALAFLAHVTVLLSLDNRIDAANYAATRFLTLVLTTLLIVVADQILIFPYRPLFILSTILSGVMGFYGIFVLYQDK